MKRTRRIAVCLAAAAATLAAGAALRVAVGADAPLPAPSEFIITADKVYPVASEAIDGGSVWIKDGRIVQVGKIQEDGAGGRIMTCVDGCALQVRADMPMVQTEGEWIFPGMIDSHTAVGLVEVSKEPTVNDEDEGPVDPLTPQLLARDGIWPETAVVPVTRVEGITSVLVVPANHRFTYFGGGNVIAGQSALIDLWGDSVGQMVVKSPVGMHVNLGEWPKDRYRAKNKMPTTRMGTAAVLRQALLDAQSYREKWNRYNKDLAAHGGGGEGKDAGKGKGASSKSKSGAKAPDRPERDLRKEALMPVLTGELPIIVRAHRADDILTGIAIAEEFGLRMILDQGTEAYKVAGELAQRRIPVLVGPVTTQPERMETLGAIYENAAKLHAAGVKIAIQTDEVHHVRHLPFEAGLAVAYGLPWEEAIRAITLSPAEIFGVQDRIGSIVPGAEANLFLAEGDPLEPATKIRRVYIRGVEVSITNRQTDLYKRFAK
jgi:imidazolonepropionase-like amidohydrolase